MLARADMALYNAKRAGRNCTRVLLASVNGEVLEEGAHVVGCEAIVS